METTKRKFFADVLNAARELQLQVQAVQKRRKQRNDGVQAWHYLLSAVCSTVHHLFNSLCIIDKYHEPIMSCDLESGCSLHLLYS